jgi:DNA-binding HxlR family transcriptional regulator
LRALERDGLVRRDVQATTPPRAEYSLTFLGRRIADKLFDLVDLVEAEMGEVRAARARYDETR